MASTSQKASEEALPAFDAEAPAPTPAPAVEVNPEAGVASECDSHEAAPKAATVDGSSSSPLTAAQEPALTPQEFRVYNRLSELMNYYVCVFSTLPLCAVRDFPVKDLGGVPFRSH